MGPLPYSQLPDGLQPDFGPSEVEPRVGLVTLGALPWLVNFNVPLKTSDLQVIHFWSRVTCGSSFRFCLATGAPQKGLCNTQWHCRNKCCLFQGISHTVLRQGCPAGC